jgi:hypothetical protein
MNTLDDGSGNMTVAASLTAVNVTASGLVTASGAAITAGTTTSSLTVNGLPLQKNINAVGLVTAASAGAATFASPLFSVGGTFAGGGTLALPVVATGTNYWVTISGAGSLVAAATGGAVITSTNSTQTTLFNATAVNGAASTQTVFSEAQAYLTVAASAASLVTLTVNGSYTSYSGSYTVLQMA